MNPTKAPPKDNPVKKKEGIALVLSAPSGTGKTTICKRLLEKYPGLEFAVSHTTRPPREGEVEGVHYFFISTEQFEQMVRNNEFLEWAQICGNYYGTSRESLDRLRKQGKDVILELDVQGAESLRNMNFSGVYIFILPPSIVELTARLRKRGTESEDKIAERVENGKKEIKKFHLYDYVVTNYEIEDTVDSIICIIRAEKLRAEYYIPPSEDISAILNS